jgi:hypothetical protein
VRVSLYTAKTIQHEFTHTPIDSHWQIQGHAPFRNGLNLDESRCVIQSPTWIQCTEKDLDIKSVDSGGERVCKERTNIWQHLE